MKAKVVKSDESVIYNGVIYSHGEEFEVDDAIGKSLIERCLIAGITDNENLFSEDEVMDAEEIIDGIVMREDIDEMTYPELKSYASELGLSASGRKDELIARINEYFSKAEEVEVEDEDGEEAEEIPNTSMPE